jgi:hypothetical protein
MKYRSRMLLFVHFMPPRQKIFQIKYTNGGNRRCYTEFWVIKVPQNLSRAFSYLVLVLVVLTSIIFVVAKTKTIDEEELILFLNIAIKQRLSNNIKYKEITHVHTSNITNLEPRGAVRK